MLPVVLLAGALVWLATRSRLPAPKMPATRLGARPARSRRVRANALAPARPKPRTFISFAVEDEAARNLFVGQSKHEDTPFELADFSLHKPFDNAWNTQTRPRIKGCDVVVVLIGKGTHAAEGVLWEIWA